MPLTFHRRLLLAEPDDLRRLDDRLFKPRMKNANETCDPWLRAAVLGANDGIVSTASLVVGVAVAKTGSNDILVADVAGLVAVRVTLWGALAMAITAGTARMALQCPYAAPADPSSRI